MSLLAERVAESVAEPSLTAPTGPPKDRTGACVVLAVVGLLAALAGALSSRHLDPGRLGLLPSLPVIWFVGLACVVVALVGSARGHRRATAIAVVALVVLLTATPAVVYDTARFPWTAKHIGVVEHIRSAGGVDERIDIYHSWPAFFAATGALADVAGLRDPMSLAQWWPALVGVARLLAFRFAAGRLIGAGRRTWIAAGLYVLADSIGQDYFSPQSIGVVLALLAAGLAVPPPDAVDDRRWVRLTLLASVATAMAVTHQLSPFFAAASVAGLALARLARPWWTPLVIAAPALAWAGLHWSIVRKFASPDQVGSITANARTTNDLDAILGNGLVLAQVTALLLGLGLVGLLAASRLVRRGDRVAVGLALAGAAPVGLLAVNGYGNEAMFRVALFAIPWLAMLAAVPRTSGTERRSWTAPLLFLVACHLVSAFSLEWALAGRVDDLDAVRAFEREAPAGSVLIHTGMTSSPSKSTARYDEFVWETRQNAGDMPSFPYDAEADVEQFTTRLVNLWRAPDYYALVAESTRAKNDLYGYMTAAQYDEFAAALASSPWWELVAEIGDARLYRLVELPPGWVPGAAQLSRCLDPECGPAPGGV